MIREARIARGYSQADFAIEADLGRTYYGRIERGETNPSIQNIIRIAITLKMEVGELIPKIHLLKKAPSRI